VKLPVFQMQLNDSVMTRRKKYSGVRAFFYFRIELGKITSKLVVLNVT